MRENPSVKRKLDVFKTTSLKEGSIINTTAFHNGKTQRGGNILPSAGSQACWGPQTLDECHLVGWTPRSPQCC